MQDRPDSLPHTFLTPARAPILVCAKPQVIFPFKCKITVGDSIPSTKRPDNMVKTGIPFMLHDRSGSLLGSDFVDLYDRMNLRVVCKRRDPDGAALFEVYNMLSKHFTIPIALFEFGAAGALGNISLMGTGGSLRRHTMASFLVEVGGPRHRKFIASDGHEYSWSWRTSTDEDLEWSCINASGHAVAWYAVSSGYMFGVEEPYPHLAVEFLTTLMIMRHIAARNT